ncbi:peptidylprolyl isomerase [Hydrogenophilus islandicus]
MNHPPQTVLPHHLVTLHYRISVGGVPMVSTFEATPATLQLGDGTLAPPLERRLLGLPVGSRHTFTLPPEEAFGPRRPDLIERVRRADLPDDAAEVGTILSFVAPDGSRYPGVVVELDDEWGVVDFNHPLAGKTIQFEVEIIGVC